MIWRHKNKTYWLINSIMCSFLIVNEQSCHVGFRSRAAEVPQCFWGGVPTSGGVPDDMSNCEFENSDFENKWNAPLATGNKMKCTLTLKKILTFLWVWMLLETFGILKSSTPHTKRDTWLFWDINVLHIVHSSNSN